MTADPRNTEENYRRTYGTVGMLILGVAIPACTITVLHLVSAGPFVYPLIHTFMESLGVLAGFSLALLLFARQDGRDHAQLVWVACGLLVMGILDGIHSVQPVGATFVGLSCASTLFGGFLFSLVWLPERLARSRALVSLPFFTAAAAAVLGFFMVARPDLLPELFGPGGYSATAKIVTTTGGVLFVVASTRFILRYRATGGFDNFLLASLCLLFGMAGAFFAHSSIWFADWWFWHLLRLVAFLHLVCYMLFLHRRTLAELQELNETLERRVMDRTAQLAAEVAERVQTEAALKVSETRYRRLVDSVTGYSYSVKVEDGRPLRTSHSSGCIAVTGYTPEEYAGDPGLWLRMVPDEERQAVLDQVALVLSGKEPPPLEHRILHKDGRVCWVKNRTVPHFDGQGRVVAYDGLISNITERKLAEEEIKTYNTELLTINRVVTACSGLLDFREVLGRVLEETMGIVGLEAGCLCVLNNNGSLNCIAQRRSSETVISEHCNDDGTSSDCFYRTCTGDLRPIILRDQESVLGFSGGRAPHREGVCFHAAFPLVTGKRSCAGVLCLYSLTEAKLSDRSLRLVETIVAHLALLIENARLYDETRSHAATLEGKVAERTRELEEANRKLREIDRIKSLFIASMSHELRTPLNSVIGFTSIILDEWVGPLNSEQKENLAIVLKAGQHLLALINDVIDVSKIEAGQIEVRRESFDLHHVVDEAVTTLREEIHNRGLRLRVENLNRVTLHTDRRRLLQCILNLLSNAAKYTEKGTISVSSVEGGAQPMDAEDARRRYAEIAVEDTGIGIASEDLGRIFCPFTRLDSSLRSRVPGTGLGLYLTRKLVTEVLKGEIRCTSQAGRGSTFTIAIPVDGGE